jgi:hypothetical protein
MMMKKNRYNVYLTKEGKKLIANGEMPTQLKEVKKPQLKVVRGK